MGQAGREAGEAVGWGIGWGGVRGPGAGTGRWVREQKPGLKAGEASPPLHLPSYSQSLLVPLVIDCPSPPQAGRVLRVSSVVPGCSFVCKLPCLPSRGWGPRLLFLGLEEREGLGINSLSGEDRAGHQVGAFLSLGPCPVLLLRLLRSHSLTLSEEPPGLLGTRAAL